MLVTVATLAGAVGVVGIVWYYGRDLPTVAAVRDYRPPQTTRVLDRHGELIGEIFRERRTVVPMDRIPRALVLAVLAAEDADFYQHEGLDYPGIVRALLRDVSSGRPAQGASTITQQVVKLLILTPERTVARKVRELILARRLEQELSKDEILALYLNHINFGHGRYGVQEAAQYYFGKNVEELSLAEATLIAGVPQSPTRLSPRSHPEAARRRQAFVLDQLLAKRERWPDLSEDDIEVARNTAVDIAEPAEPSERAPEALALAGQLLRETLSEDDYARGGYTVYTTVDLSVQRAARMALRKNLEAFDARHGHRAPLQAPRRRDRGAPGARQRTSATGDGDRALRLGRSYAAVVTGADDEAGTITVDINGHPGVIDVSSAARYNPAGLPASRFAEVNAEVHVSILRLPEAADGDVEASAEARMELGPQGAVVVIDPRTREVLALVGAYEETAGFNRATQALRQPGSTFKPLVYALGIHSRRFTAASVVLDAPAVYDQWNPQNYETWNYEGAVRVREALAKSINSVAVRIIEEVTPVQTVEFARSLGITSELDPSLPLALGASDVRPIELTNAYATFAAGGRFEESLLVRRIEGPDHQSIPLPQHAPPRDVLTPAEAYVVTSMLTSVVSDGTARGARALARPAAGKTGTSNQARDAWFVGFTPGTVAGVWVGYDDRRSLGRRESGGRAAVPIWVDVLRAIEEDLPVVDFPVPSGITTARIDPVTGLLAYEGLESAIEEVFVTGTEPTEMARPPEVADTNTFLMEQFGDAAAPPAVVDGPSDAPDSTEAGDAPQ